jgi:hypothetical protein
LFICCWDDVTIAALGCGVVGQNLSMCRSVQLYNLSEDPYAGFDVPFNQSINQSLVLDSYCEPQSPYRCFQCRGTPSVDGISNSWKRIMHHNSCHGLRGKSIMFLLCIYLHRGVPCSLSG